jgi:hypothetical protein
MVNPPDPPKIPTAEELYDQIMGGIEPELMRANLEKLDALYVADSTKEKKEARAKKYEEAFEKFYKKVEEYVEDLYGKAKKYYNSSLKTIEEEDRGKELSEGNFDALVAAA